MYVQIPQIVLMFMFTSWNEQSLILLKYLRDFMNFKIRRTSNRRDVGNIDWSLEHVADFGGGRLELSISRHASSWVFRALLQSWKPWWKVRLALFAAQMINYATLKEGDAPGSLLLLAVGMNSSEAFAGSYFYWRQESVRNWPSRLFYQIENTD